MVTVQATSDIPILSVHLGQLPSNQVTTNGHATHGSHELPPQNLKRYVCMPTYTPHTHFCFCLCFCLCLAFAFAFVITQARPCYLGVPLLPGYAPITQARPCYLVTPLLPVHAQVTQARPYYSRTPLLPIRAPITRARPC